MKMKFVIVALVVVCAGLAVALIASKSTTGSQLNNNSAAIFDISNQLVTTSENLDELRQVNLRLTNDLAAAQRQASRLSNNISAAASALAAARAARQGDQEQIANLNGRITDLETQNRALDDRADSLSNTIVALNAQIADTEQKLAFSETNNLFLEKELQEQIAQRAELQRKFDDINAMRAQVKKLRNEQFVSRRVELMRNSATEHKGAELMMAPRKAARGLSSATTQSHYDLNVEVGSDGSVHVIPPPTPPKTDSPAR